MSAIEIESTESEFEEKLNDLYGTVEICGQIFDQGTALRELDPTAFRVAHADEPISYGCSECGDVFEDEDEAEECCPPQEVPDSEIDRFEK